MSEIVVVAPVLTRPQNARPLVESLVASTRCSWRLIFVCSPGDDDEIAACTSMAAFDGVQVMVVDWEPGPGDFARKQNLAFEFSAEPYLLLGADDLVFHAGWDAAAVAVAREFDVGVVGTNDQANPSVIAGRHSTHPLVARAYIDAHGGYVNGLGKVYFEGYDHQMVDSELCQTAMARGCYAHVHSAVVQHRHPIFDRSVSRDATYRKGQAEGAADRALFESRRHLWERERAAA